MDVFPAGLERPRVVLDVADYGDRYSPALVPGQWQRHPLLEASLVHVGLPEDVSVEIHISCGVPAGAATGTSAAVTVALVGALEHLHGHFIDRRAVARAAHEIETDRLGQQSGIQDQICSALGGINDIEMTSYPRADVRPVVVDAALRQELERRFVVVFPGGGHDSSGLHQRVIDRLRGIGPECPELQVMRQCAAEAVRAVTAGDLAELGRAMTANTESQRRLHPDLVSADADRIMTIARAHGAAGWKVNGAGGAGGSLTVLGPASPGTMESMLRAIAAESPAFRHIQTTLDMDGLRVWDSRTSDALPRRV